MIQQAVASCHKIGMGCQDVQVTYLLDSGSKVTLVHQSYCKKKCLPIINPHSGEMAEVFILLQLMVTNKGKLPVMMYAESDLNFLELKFKNLEHLLPQIVTHYLILCTK